MEIFNTFGINWTLTIAQIVNFLVVLYVLKRYLYKPLFNVLKKRQDLAKESIKNAEDSQKALEKAKEQEEKIIKQAHETAQQIVSDAREQSASILKDSEAQTKQKTDQMIKTAKEQIELEKVETEAQLNKYVMNLSVELLRKTLPTILTEKEQSEIINKTIKSMKKQAN